MTAVGFEGFARAELRSSSVSVAVVANQSRDGECLSARFLGQRLAIASTNSCMPPARVTNRLQRAPLPVSRLRARAAVRPHRQDDASWRSFHFFEARHGGGETELVGIRGIDAAD